MFSELLSKHFLCVTIIKMYSRDANAENEEDAGDSIEAGEDEMVLENDPNDDGVAKAIAEVAQKAELECIAEVAEES